MKTLSLYHLFPVLLGLAMLVLAGCSSDDQPGPVSTGRLCARAQSDTPMPLDITITSTEGAFKHVYNDPSQLSALELEIGDYIIEASAGNADSQGYGCQYYWGKEGFSILADQMTELTLTAKPQKAEISVLFSDAFKGYMSSYSARLNDADLDCDNPEPYVILPTQAVVKINYVLPSGKEGQFEAARFEAKAGVKYDVKVDVNNGEMGKNMISVTIDDNLDREEINIEI